MKIVFVGCNITNLIIATLIVFLTKYKVIIVEKSNEIGGNYKSLNVNNLKLDLGMRLLYSSNIPFIDKFYKKIFYKKFYFLKKEKKDLAGIIYNKNIFHKSNYLDLSGLNKIKKKIIFNHFLKNKKIKTHKNLKDYLKSKFGSFLYVNYFSKIYYNIFQTSPKKLSPLAANIVQQKRIILYDDNYNRFFYKNKNFRDFFAISDQRKVPKKYLNKQFGIYPKKYGAYNIIVHLKKIFLKNGGKLIKNASVKSLDIKKNKIESINYEGLNSKIHKIDNIKYIIFSGNILFLLNLLKLKFNNNFISKPSRYYYVYCIMNNCEFFRDLYYFYDFTKSKIFRITNYYNYSYSKQHKNIICLELIPKNEMTNNEILKYLRKYFSNKKKFNSKIKKIIKIIKSYREPLPTTKNIKKIDSISKKINNLKIKNLIVNLPFFLKKNFYMFEQVETLYYYFKQKKLF